eukprot:g12168.t1
MNMFQLEGVLINETWEELCILDVKSSKIPEALRKQVLVWFDLAKVRYTTGKDADPEALQAETELEIGNAKVMKGDVFKITACTRTCRTTFRNYSMIRRI